MPDQQGQTVHGHQINAGRDANIEQVGDRYQIENAQINLPPELIRQLLAANEEKSSENFAAPTLETEPWEPQTVFIPAGPILMGSQPGNDIPNSETPQFTISLPAYRIGLYPITNEQFAQFVWKTGRVASSTLLWDGNTPTDDKLDHPVTGVTWYEAINYCRWLSESTDRLYFLPTEAQWEKGARLEDGRIFPWGNEWESGRCQTEKGVETAVTEYPPQNEIGLFDMVGNAREWTLTAWGTNSRQPDKIYAYPRPDDTRNGYDEPTTTRRVYRGGWSSEQRGFRCSARGSYLPEKSGPKHNRHGFRVVMLPIK
jgi:formylglycine-generating enzyme required for sulfatase activity